MDVLFRHSGVDFIWDARKASGNLSKHGIRFERACEAFFDPLLIVLDAGVEDEEREAIVGAAVNGELLFVVHMERQSEVIRIISARVATAAERNNYENNA